MLSEYPFFSIVIATYNRPKELGRCLESLKSLNYPQDLFEVIIVDDGGPIPLTNVVEPFRVHLEIKLIRQANRGCGAARNAGAKQARGDYLAFTDDDCIHTPDWLKSLAAHFALNPDAMIGGRTINRLERNPYSAASQLITDYLFSHYNARPESARYLNSIALPSLAFHALGGFDESFFMSAEDRDFCERWLKAGCEMVYLPELIIFHAHHLTLRTFFRQHFNYGRGAFHYHRRHPAPTSQKKGARALSFYLKLLSYAFSQSDGPRGRALVLTTLIFLSQFAIGCGWLHERVSGPGMKAAIKADDEGMLSEKMSG